MKAAVNYSQQTEKYLRSLENLIDDDYPIAKRSIALLIAQGDSEIIEMVYSKQKNNKQIKELISNSDTSLISLDISTQLQKKSSDIVKKSVTIDKAAANGFRHYFNYLVMNPVTGIPILLLVLYFGFYKFVGVFGAGTLVDIIETKIFDQGLNPFLNNFVNGLIHNRTIADLFVNDYGIFTMAIKYAIAIVLPIVGCFFLMFSIIEDSGYLPRISLLLDRVFKKIGLNGRAVIPMTLGFGCDTMATMVSRTLETKRERVIATFLLALAIPCSAQLGVILAILSGNLKAMLIWLLFMAFVFMFIGFLTAKLFKGNRPAFYMELPALRLPRLKNIIKKTYTRMYWYFKEVLPLFIFASFLIWLGNITGIFGFLINLLVPVVKQLGLPDKMAEVFLYGFFRRDFGAAGLLEMQSQGVMNARQLVVAASTLTLFVPCVAQFIMMVKERGTKTALAIAAFIFPFSFAAGFVLNKIILLLGVGL